RSVLARIFSHVLLFRLKRKHTVTATQLTVTVTCKLKNRQYENIFIRMES
ncbi:hypothetical protein SAMN06265379_1201, partial [Saccharicrinis carchari]